MNNTMNRSDAVASLLGEKAEGEDAKEGKPVRVGELKVVVTKPKKKNNGNGNGNGSHSEPGQKLELTTQPPAQALIEPKKLLTRAEQIAAAKQQMNARGLIDKARQDREDKKNPVNVATFVEAMDAAEELAVTKFGGVKEGEDEVRKWWRRLSCEGVEGELKGWVRDGDTSPAGILITLFTFKDAGPDGKPVNGDLMKFMWELYTKVIRAAKALQTFEELYSYMNELCSLKYITSTPPKFRSEFVRVNHEGTDYNYFPVLVKDGEGRMVPSVAWEYVKAARGHVQKAREQRFEQRGTKFNELKTQDTGLTALQVEKQSKSGKVFLVTNEEKKCGALISIKVDGSWMGIQILAVVGIWLKNRPKPIPYRCDSGDWPDLLLFTAFKKWQQQTAETQKP